MKVLEVTGTDYPTARELPNDRSKPANGTQHGNASGGAGTGKTRSYIPKLTGKALADLQKADQVATAENKRVLWLVNGKLKFEKAS
jgi:hypothetical protein